MEILLKIGLVVLALFVICQQYIAVMKRNSDDNRDEDHTVNPLSVPSANDSHDQHIPITNSDLDEMNYIGVRGSTLKENRFLARKLPIRNPEIMLIFIIFITVVAGILIALDEFWGEVMTNMAFCVFSIFFFIKCSRPLATRRVDRCQGKILRIFGLHRNPNLTYIRFVNHTSKDYQDKLAIPRSFTDNLVEGQRYNFERCGNLVVSINNHSINTSDDPIFNAQDPRWHYFILCSLSLFIIRSLFWASEFSMWSLKEVIPLLIIFGLIICSIRYNGLDNQE